MNFEDFQKSWQNQNAGSKISINADLLLKEVRRNQQQLRTTILLRDLREVSAAFILTGIFIFFGLRQQNWTDYLIALACFGIGVYMVVDRRFQRRKRPDLHDSLKGCVETSLAEVSHQIWLLKNVFWWYLLPIAVTVLFSVFWSECHSAKPGPEIITDLSVSLGVVVLVNWIIYWVNQLAVRKYLEPRRQELESLLASLGQ